MYYQRLSDDAILSGFREGDADIIRECFYGYCQVGYNIFDQRYQLREKENLDFIREAIMGQGVGLQGQSYGIPTMQGGVGTIRPYVDEFIQFAKEHQ